MITQQLAEKLNGREYSDEITKEEEAEAKAAGLIVVFGYSDDNAEFRGAIHEEAGAYDVGTFYLHSGGILSDPSDGDCEDCGERTEAQQKFCAKVGFEFGGDTGYSWYFTTGLPHSTFDVMEGAEKFCRGIVIDSKDLPKLP